DTFATAELIPDKICSESREGNDCQRTEEAEAMTARESAGREKEWKRRNGKADLLSENPGQQHDIPVMEEELNCAVHSGGWASRTRRNVSIMTEIGLKIPTRKKGAGAPRSFRYRGPALVTSYCCLVISRSMVMLTSSLTTAPPLSMVLFHFTPNSCR